MAPIAIRYGRQALDDTIDREASQAHALPTTEGHVIWDTVPIPSPVPAFPRLFVELPPEYDLIDAVGLPPADYVVGWQPAGGTRYVYDPEVVRQPRHEVPWLTTVIAEPVLGVVSADALTVRFGRLDPDGAVHAGTDTRAHAVVTTEGDIYWLAVPLQSPTNDAPGHMFIELPTGYRLISSTSLTDMAYEADGWQREGATDRYVYRPEDVTGGAALRPAFLDVPWPTTLLARPRVSEVTIGVDGYCTAGDVIRASNVRDASRSDVIEFIANGFDHINALFNISSSELRLVPPIVDTDLIDALKRLNIDFGAGRLLLSLQDATFGKEFMDRFDTNLNRMIGKLTKKSGDPAGVRPTRTVYGGD